MYVLLVWVLSLTGLEIPFLKSVERMKKVSGFSGILFRPFFVRPLLASLSPPSAFDSLHFNFLLLPKGRPSAVSLPSGGKKEAAVHPHTCVYLPPFKKGHVSTNSKSPRTPCTYLFRPLRFSHFLVCYVTGTSTSVLLTGTNFSLSSSCWKTKSAYV